MVWTLEENTQQKAGIPREFTFVFLLERLVPSDHTPLVQEEIWPHHNQKLLASLARTKASDSVNNIRSEDGSSQDDQSIGLEVIGLDAESGYAPSTSTQYEEYNGTPGHGIVSNLRAEAGKLTKKLRRSDGTQSLRTIKKRKASMHSHIDDHYSQVFTDIEFNIAVRPEIAGMNIPKGVFEHHAQLTTVKSQVGQKFSSMSEEYSEGEGLAINGLYNFAKLPVNFEDLIELPGSTVSTVVCLPKFGQMPITQLIEYHGNTD